MRAARGCLVDRRSPQSRTYNTAPDLAPRQSRLASLRSAIPLSDSQPPPLPAPNAIRRPRISIPPADVSGFGVPRLRATPGSSTPPSSTSPTRPSSGMTEITTTFGNLKVSSNGTPVTAFVRVTGPPNSNMLVGYPGISATVVRTAPSPAWKPPARTASVADLRSLGSRGK